MLVDATTFCYANSRMITEQELKDRLEKWIDAVTLDVVSNKCGVSKTFLHAVRKGKRPVSPSIAAQLGYQFAHKESQIQRFYSPLENR